MIYIVELTNVFTSNEQTVIINSAWSSLASIRQFADNTKRSQDLVTNVATIGAVFGVKEDSVSVLDIDLMNNFNWASELLVRASEEKRITKKTKRSIDNFLENFNE